MPPALLAFAFLLLLTAPALADPGFLTFVEVQKDGVAGVDGLFGAVGAAVSPDGQHLYVGGFHDKALAVFSRDAATGKLSLLEVHKDGVAGVDGLDGAEKVAVSPDGLHVYATGFNDNSLAVFSRNTFTGRLSFVEVHKDGVAGVDGLAAAFGVTVSPDGKHVYVAAFSDSSVAVFSRNPVTGRLSFLEVHKDDVAGVDGLLFATGVAVSPEGKHLYATGFNDSAIAVFSRDAATGRLSFLEALKHNAAVVDGLLRAAAVALSPDGSHLYVTGHGESAVGVYSRNAATGKLSFLEAHQDGVAGVDGLFGALGLAVSPNGKHVYVTGVFDNALAAFARDAATGRLSFLEFHKDGVAGVDGLAEAHLPVVSPDSRHLYATGTADNAVAVFRTPLPLPVPALTPWALGALAGAFLLLTAWALRQRGRIST